MGFAEPSFYVCNCCQQSIDPKRSDWVTDHESGMVYHRQCYYKTMFKPDTRSMFDRLYARGKVQPAIAHMTASVSMHHGEGWVTVSECMDFAKDEIQRALLAKELGHEPK